MAALKCPNPSCSFLFDPSQVPEGAVLTCPRCAMRFTLGGVHFPAPTSSGAPTTVVTNSSATVSDSTQIPSVDAALFAFDSMDEPELEIEEEARGGNLVFWILGGAIAVISLIVVVLIVKRVSDAVGPTPSGAQELRVLDKNFIFMAPASPWTKDPETQQETGVTVIAYRRQSPEAWIALSVNDYQTRMPYQLEMRQKVFEHLKRIFVQMPEALNFEPAKWGSLDADRARFRAEHKTSGAVCEIEAWTGAHKGIGYWFYSWAPERDRPALEDELSTLREGLKIQKERESWTEKAVKEIVYPGKKHRYRLSNYEAIWSGTGLEPTDDGDDRADLLLRGEIKLRGKGEAPRRAKLTVAVLPASGDPQAVAEAHVRKRFTPEVETFGETQITKVNEEPTGEPPVGPETAGTPVFRLHAAPVGDSTRDAEKLIVAAVVKSGDLLYVAYADCPWLERDLWERRLLQLVGSLRAQ